VSLWWLDLEPLQETVRILPQRLPDRYHDRASLGDAAMKIDPRAAALVAVMLAAALALGAAGQDQAARSGVLNVRECMDKGRNRWMAKIDQEILKMQEADSGRASDLNPQERARLRTQNLDRYNQRRLELYGAVVRHAGAVAKERGYDLVHRGDRLPVTESGEPELMTQIFSRDIVVSDPAIDITAEVVDRINQEHAGRKQ
jgi:Skp family chaperone for outer membrane proteins